MDEEKNPAQEDAVELSLVDGGHEGADAVGVDSVDEAAASAWESAVAVAEAASAAKAVEANAMPEPEAMLAEKAEGSEPLGEAVAVEAEASVIPDIIDVDGEDGDESEDADGAKKRPKRFSRLRWSNLSYVSRISLAFALMAVLTASIAIGSISVVWGQYFQNYTKQNMQTVAATAAGRIALSYEEQGRLDPAMVRSIIQAAITSSDVGVKVLDANDNTVYENVAEGPNTNGNSFEPSDAAQIAIAKIIADNTDVGSVHLWVFGSDTLMNKLDLQFRDDSYMVLALSSIVAVVAATLFGLAFARSLVQPINRLTRTAAAVKAGKLSARSNLTGEDEIAHLGETFDSMIASVEKDRRLEQRLTSDVAHELRTPLMSIQASMEAMIDGVYVADAEHLSTVNTEVQRLSRLVNALLKLSRLENRSRPMNEKAIDLGELVGEIVQTHEQFVADSGLKLGFYADNRVLVMGDSDMIRQAVVNLISNAVRYTPSPGSIDVSVRRGTAMASISVRDTGIGLSEEEAKMVFSRFWRADAGRNRESGGLGIGLAVVKEIVDRHNGWVGVEGETGKGATFTIHLPLYEDTISRVRARAARERRQGSLLGGGGAKGSQ